MAEAVLEAPAPIKKKTIDSIKDDSELQYLFNKHGMFVLHADPKTQELKLCGYVQPKDFIDDICRQHSTFQTGIMSPNTIYYEKLPKIKGTDHIIIKQLPPQIIEISYEENVEDPESKSVKKEVTEFVISLPYTQWCFHIVERLGICTTRDCCVSCSLKPIRSEKDPILSIPLNNIHPNDGKICWGNNPIECTEKDTPFSITEKAISLFFEAKFNSDYNPKWPSNLTCLEEWQRITKEDPQKLNDVKFNPHPRTCLERIITEMRASK